MKTQKTISDLLIPVVLTHAIKKSSFKLLFVTTITLFYATKASSQDSIVDQDVKVNQQGWVDYNFNKALGENKFLSTQMGFRKISPEVYDRYLTISTLNIRTKKGFKLFQTEGTFINSYQLGGGVIYTRNYDANDNLEIRFLQGLKFNIPTIKGFKLYNYSRLEERFQTSFDGGGLRTGFRLRHRVSAVISWKKHYLNFTEGLYFPLSAEIFFNLKRAERFNDLLRLSPGIGYKLENGWRFELFTIFNRTRNITETNDKSSDFILRLRIYSANKEKNIQLAPVNEFEPEENPDN